MAEVQPPRVAMTAGTDPDDFITVEQKRRRASSGTNMIPRYPT
jgi:hypothetical protein